MELRATVTLRMSSFKIMSQQKKQIKPNASNLAKLPHVKHYLKDKEAQNKTEKLTLKWEGELY